MNRKAIAPKNYAFALVTLRYNFVASRAKVQRARYEGEIATLGDRLNVLQRKAAEAKELADEAENARRQAEQNGKPSAEGRRVTITVEQSK